MATPVTPLMTTSRTAILLAWLIAALALIAAGVGLFWQEGDDSVFVITARGETVELYGRGLYYYDTIFAGAGQRGTDAITLFLGIPLLLFTGLRYRSGSLRGGLMFAGVLSYFLYVYASAALGTVAYNDFFLIYVVLFGASFFTVFIVLLSMHLGRLPESALERVPWLRSAHFLFFAGVVTLIVWLMVPIAALVQNETPRGLDTATTLFTYALDLAIIAPACLLAGMLMLRRDPRGILISVPLLGIVILLGPVLVAQTVSQLAAGVTFSTGELIGPLGGFGVVAVLAVWIALGVLRALPDSDLERRGANTRVDSRGGIG